MNIRSLADRHVRGTEKDAIVEDVKLFVCHLTSAVVKGLGFPTKKSYINARILKHIYDKKPAEEFDFLIDNLHQVVKYPDHVYANKPGKRGMFCLVKIIKNASYLCSLEIVTEPECELWIVTAFRVQDNNYLRDYKLLWSWRGGNPSS